ncbi:MAG: formyltransferase family protein [Chitinophagaceae bacterium]
MKDNLKILFIGKAGDPYSIAAAAFLEERFTAPRIIYSNRSDRFPEELLNWKGDLVISYLAQWVIPQALLDNAAMAAINFHPGPPSYPGIGCTNFAIYNDEKEYGITCHHMLAKVDTGEIIEVRRFPVHPIDTVYSVTQRCYIEILYGFYSIMTGLLKEKKFPLSTEKWTRKPYTRKELNELCLAMPEMGSEEIQKRLKATTFGDRIWLQVKVDNELVPYDRALKNGIIQ